MMQEEWRDIPGHEGSYQVSDQGRVRSLPRYVSFYRDGKESGFPLAGRILRSWITNSGYLRVKPGRVAPFVSIHRLVASAFIPNQDGKPTVNHKNGIKTDNRACNLEWATLSENMKHAHANGLVDTAKTAASKSKRVQGVRLQDGFTVVFPSTKVAGENGFNQSHVSQCALGHIRQHKGYVWSFV